MENSEKTISSTKVGYEKTENGYRIDLSPDFYLEAIVPEDGSLPEFNTKWSDPSKKEVISTSILHEHGLNQAVIQEAMKKFMKDLPNIKQEKISDKINTTLDDILDDISDTIEG